MIRNFVRFSLLCLAPLACANSSALAPLPPGGVNVLFVGNSLTYVNDLPATVAAIGASAGDTIRVGASVGANLALIDHLNGGSDAPVQIRRGGWQFVILQQGPTTAGLCRDSLVLWTRLFAPIARESGSRLALLMPWAGITHQDLFDEVRVSFEAASSGVGGVFIPAGEAWRSVLASVPEISPYGSDGFHPSPAGTFLTALVIYERVTGRDPQTLPAQAFANGRPFTLPASTVRALQRAAHQANAQFSPAQLPSPEELALPSRYISTHPGC